MGSFEQPGLFQSGESSPEASPAKTSPWQDAARAWLAHARDCSGTSCGWPTSCVHAGSFLRTSPGSCRPSAPVLVTKPAWTTADLWSAESGEPSESLVLPMNSSPEMTASSAGTRGISTTPADSAPPARTPAKDSRKSSSARSSSRTSRTTSREVPAQRVAWQPTGEQWVPSSGRWENAGMGSPTECWTLSSSESPSGAVACSLSDVLETGSDLSKYCLSPRAAKGILRRAGRRGRDLPRQLAEALSRLSRAEDDAATA